MINPHRRGRLPQAALQGKEKARLIFIAVGFVLLVAIFLGLKLWGISVRAKEKKLEGEVAPIDVAEERTEDGRTIFRYKTLDARQKRDLAEDDLSQALGKLVTEGVLTDGKPKDPPEVLTFLVNQFTWNHLVGGVGEGLYRKLPEADALFEPGPFRGRFTSTWGQVVEVLPELPFEVAGTGVETLYRAYVRTEGGRLYHITTYKPIEREPGDWIQVYGIFYRTMPYEIEGEPVQALALLVAKDLKRAYPPIVVNAIDPAWGDQVKELTQEQAKNTDERPFWLILNYLKTKGLEAYRAKRDAGEIHLQQMGKNAKPLISLPEEYRFEHVAAYGKVIQPELAIPQSDNPGKIDAIHSAILLQPSEYMVLLVSPRPWEEYGFRVEDDYVQAEGVFYKRWVYMPSKGAEALEIPLVLVTDVRKIERGSSVLMVALPWVCGALAAGLLVLFLGLALKDRRQLREFRERYAERQRGRSPGGGSSPGEPPAE
ncbi:MAG: hypothetical protein ACYTDY_06435 [Planctomycetota bacterium]|jgi:hypothetical protein